MKLLFIDITTQLNSFTDLETKGRGGMVSSLYLLPNALSQIGHEVSVLSDVKQGGTTKDGVRWLVESDMEWLVRSEFDFIILNRQTYGDCFDEIRAKHRILWVHDMVHGGFVTKPGVARVALSATIFMSWYSEETWRSYYRDWPKRSFRIPNGVDDKLFYPGDEKDLRQVIFFSAPNRGLEYLPIIKETVEGGTGVTIRLVAFSRMSKLHPVENDDKFQDIYDSVRARGVDLRDPVPQSELAAWVRSSGIMVKPNDYAETCSNVVLQSLASGVPVVTTPVGADKEFVKTGWNGIVTKHTLQDGPLFVMEVIRGVAEILRDKKFHRKLIKNAPKTKRLYTWKEIGFFWSKALTRVF